jgi:hypothetical protein
MDTTTAAASTVAASSDCLLLLPTAAAAAVGVAEDEAVTTPTTVTSAKRPRKRCRGAVDEEFPAAVAVVEAKRRRKMWAPIREKLGSRLTAQMEGGQKLTINSRCTNKCPGQDQNVFLYQNGVQRLLDHCGEIRTALHHSQHYSIVLEVRTDICINQIDFVVATAIGNRLMLIYVEFDMLGAIVTCAAAASIANGGINPLRTQTIGMSLGAFEKLEQFSRRHMSIDSTPLQTPPPPPAQLPTIAEEEKETERGGETGIIVAQPTNLPAPAVTPPSDDDETPESPPSPPSPRDYPPTMPDTYEDFDDEEESTYVDI